MKSLEQAKLISLGACQLEENYQQIAASERMFKKLGFVPTAST